MDSSMALFASSFSTWLEARDFEPHLLQLRALRETVVEGSPIRLLWLQVQDGIFVVNPEAYDDVLERWCNERLKQEAHEASIVLPVSGAHPKEADLGECEGEQNQVLRESEVTDIISPEAVLVRVDDQLRRREPRTVQELAKRG